MAQTCCRAIFRVERVGHVEDTSQRYLESIADSDGCVADGTSLRRPSLGDPFAIAQSLSDAL